jgi:hypothetical protein
MDTVVGMPAMLTRPWLKLIDMPFIIACVVMCTGIYNMLYRIQRLSGTRFGHFFFTVSLTVHRDISVQ